MPFRESAESITYASEGSAAPSRGAVGPRSPSTYLFVALDCERLHDAASRYLLDGLVMVHIGRGPLRSAVRSADGTTLVMTLPDRRASREHAQLRLRDGRWTIVDLGAKNGIHVNGCLVEGAAALSSGDIIEIGHTFMIFRTSSTATPLADVIGVQALPEQGLVTLRPELLQQFDYLAAYARTRGNVTILGETGTGKDVVANAYHRLTRRDGRMVPVNCGGLPATLLEAAMFGHKRGAYSGAGADNEGLVRAADGGTLFLDEVGDLPLPAQAAMLRVIESREVLPLGASRPVAVDVRVVCATHRDIPALVAKGEFRQDLWARLSSFVLTLPPLRTRREDIGLLFYALLRRHAEDSAPRLRITPGAGRALMSSAWPLNIRELANKTARALALTAGDTVTEEYFDLEGVQEDNRGSTPAEVDELAAEIPSDRKMERRRMLEQLLSEHGGNITYVAKSLGKTRPMIYKWLHQLGIDLEQFRS